MDGVYHICNKKIEYHSCLMVTWKEKGLNLASILVHSEKTFYGEIWYLEANAEQQSLNDLIEK